MTQAAERAPQVRDFWGELWLGAGNATGDAVRGALAHVRRLPYWDRANGADHFMVFSYDRGARPRRSGRTGARPAPCMPQHACASHCRSVQTAAPHAALGGACCSS